jgi:hypothetical protein
MKNIILSFSLLIAARGFAGNLAVDQSSLDGGGGTCSGGRFSVTGSVGQPDAGMMRGGSFAVEAGLWSLFTVVQTPGAPVLKIVRSGATAVLSWPSAEGTFQLQSNPDLAVANGWANVPQNATTNNGSVSVTVPLSPGSKFFRLKK